MNTIQVSIAANEEHQEILISELSDLGAHAFEQTETHLFAYIHENSFENDDVNKILKGYTVIINTTQEKNWNEEWERNFQPVVVGNFCAIRAEFHEPISNVAHEIIITPKMSFGTGHHATTYLMIKQMEGIDFRNKKVLDFGTGTGILSILAEKLGAANIKAIDIDSWSIENAKENIVRNDCSKISVNLSSQIPEETFDIVLANINRNVILQYIITLSNCLKTNGSLLLSGILTTDQQDIAEACKAQNFNLTEQNTRDNWSSQLWFSCLQGV